MKYIDKFLNSITMYRLVLYGLFIITITAIAAAFFELISQNWIYLVLSLLLFLSSSFIFDIALSKFFKAPANTESFLITALILFLIFPPAANTQSAYMLITASAIAAASKYVFAVHKKHIFNPAAVAAVVFGFTTWAATWWVGSAPLLPFVLITGLLVVRKIRKSDMFFAFVLSAIVLITLNGIRQGTDAADLLMQVLLSWPLVFFGTIMLTEPQTSPATKRHRIIFGILVGLIFGSQWNIGPLYPSPEVALVFGNIYAWAVSYKRRLLLTLKEKREIASQVYEFAFEPSHTPRFTPGQYMEWTLPERYSDSRGNRRYFTIASSPTEKLVRLGVKIPDNHSSFKTFMLDLKSGDTLAASSLAGDFTLPNDPKEKLVLIGGGIGVTPFRSMIKWLKDTNQTRNIILFYAVVTPQEIAYKDTFESAESIGVSTVYIAADPESVPESWNGERGFITKDILKRRVKDWNERTFYLSGPEAMVSNYKKLLKSMGVSPARIKTDYFPGF